MRVNCPKCNARLKGSKSLEGRQVQCPKCKASFFVAVIKAERHQKTDLLEIASELNKSWFGRYKSSYACPSCNEPLRSSEEEIGHRIGCPSCGVPFLVPGTAELEKIKTSKRLEAEEAQAKRDEKRRLIEETEAKRLQEEEARRREEARIEAQKAAHPFDYPVEYSVNRDGRIEFRDDYFEVMHHNLRVNPDVELADGKIIIKSIRLFKKRVTMTKKDNAKNIRDTRASYRESKPRLHKSRRKGLLPALLNVGIEVSRASHDANLDNALSTLEARDVMYEEILFACDQLIHQIEIRMAEAR